MTQEELARRLKCARMARRYTQADAARAIGVSRSVIAQIERGARSVSCLELDRLAALYGRDLKEFFAESFPATTPIDLLCRRYPALAGDSQALQRLAQAVAGGRQLAIWRRAVQCGTPEVPSYHLPFPSSQSMAIRQGEQVAVHERRRLGLGDTAVLRLGWLLESLGVYTDELPLPDTIPAIQFRDDEIGPVVIANQRIVQEFPGRRGLLLAAAYGSVLMDPTPQTVGGRSMARLADLRALAFASEFLMPSQVILSGLQQVGKGQKSRVQVAVPTGNGSAKQTESRSDPWSREIGLHDLVLFAAQFGVDPQSVAWKLKTLRVISPQVCAKLTHPAARSSYTAVAAALGVSSDRFTEPPQPARAFRLAVVYEAYRRGILSATQLAEAAPLIGIDADRLAKFPEIAQEPFHL